MEASRQSTHGLMSTNRLTLENVSVRATWILEVVPRSSRQYFGFASYMDLRVDTQSNAAAIICHLSGEHTKWVGALGFYLHLLECGFAEFYSSDHKPCF